MLDQWLVIITGPRYIDELRKMSEDEVSLPRGLGEVRTTIIPIYPSSQN